MDNESVNWYKMGSWYTYHLIQPFHLQEFFFLQMYSKVCKWAHLQGNQRCIAYSTTSKN